MIRIIFALFTIFIVSGCAARSAGPTDIYQVSALTYGKIVQIRPVYLDGGWAEGAAIGATIGYASGSGQSDKNKFIRALAAGIAGGLVQKTYSTKTVFEYTIRLRGTHQLIEIVSDRSGAMVTDCLEIGYNNVSITKLERVHGDFCIRIP